MSLKILYIGGLEAVGLETVEPETVELEAVGLETKGACNGYIHWHYLRHTWYVV